MMAARGDILNSTQFDFSKQEKCKERNNNCKDKVNSSLRTADAFTVVASLPPKNIFGGRGATTGNASAVRRLGQLEFFRKLRTTGFL